MVRRTCRCWIVSALAVVAALSVTSALAQDAPVNTSLVGTWNEYIGLYADVWGEGNFAYVGSFTLGDGNLASVHIIDISDPTNPTTAATYIVPSPNQGRSPQDVKVANGMLFIGFEASGTDLVEIVDVRDPTNPTHAGSIQVSGFSSCHNTFFDNGHLYLVDSSSPRVAIVDLTDFDLDNPPIGALNEKWVINNIGNVFVHDITVKNNRLYAAAWDSGLWIYNVEFVDVAMPTFLGSVGGNNTHSMWPTDDGMFVVTGEERSGGGIDVYEIVDFGNSVDLILRDSLVLTGDAFSVHNQVVVGNRLYVSWYQAGLQVFEIDPFFGTLEFFGSYDTSSAGLGGFAGAWGVYPLLGSDKVLVTDLEEGLFIIDVQGPQISFNYPDGLVELADPNGGTEVRVEILPEQDAPDPNTGQLFTSVDGGPFTVASSLVLDLGVFVGTLPAAPCAGTIEYYVSIDTLGGMTITDPFDAPDTSYSALVASAVVEVLSFDFEVDTGWTVSGDATDGQWERDVPIDVCDRGNPLGDFDGSGSCYLTDNQLDNDCNSDVDGGTTILTSPAIDISGLSEPFVEYARWFSNTVGGSPNEDAMLIEISNDDGNNWFALETIGPGGSEVSGGWFLKTFRVGDFLPPTSTMRFRFSVPDLGNGSVVEAALDAVRFFDVVCNANESPTILIDPVGQTVCEAGDVTFSVVADGVEPLTYQWRIDDVDIPSATEDSLTIFGAGASDAGMYTCEVTNDFGSVISNPAELVLILLSSCDDSTACTVDTCASAACVNTDTTPAGQCCDPTTGLLESVDDGDVCTDDECDAQTGTVLHLPVAPLWASAGGRNLFAFLQPSCTDPVALLVASPAFPCLSKYVAADGRLVDAPVFQEPAVWSAVFVSDIEIIPETQYTVQTENMAGVQSVVANAATWKWGDVDHNNVINLADVQLIVLGFQGDFDDVTPEAADLEPCTPNRVINLADAFSAVLAFQGQVYGDTACVLPCE